MAGLPPPTPMQMHMPHRNMLPPTNIQPPRQPPNMPGVPHLNGPNGLPTPTHALTHGGQHTGSNSHISSTPGSQTQLGSVASIKPSSFQIKVGWFAENTLTIPDIGLVFENICLPGNLINVELGQFDSLLTVRSQEDVTRIQKALTTGGVKIKNQNLTGYMVMNQEPAPAAAPPPQVPQPIQGTVIPASTEKKKNNSRETEKQSSKERDSRKRDRSESSRNRESDRSSRDDRHRDRDRDHRSDHRESHKDSRDYRDRGDYRDRDRDR